MDYENHWLQGDDDYREPTEPDFNEMVKDIEKNWRKYDWEKLEILDHDPEERSEDWIVKTDIGDYHFDAIATYCCGELIKVEDVELKS